jgi:Sugar-specific transcriptional regulator TrmB
MAGLGVLDPIGVTGDEEHVYRLLLTDPGASASELAAHCTLGRARLQRAISQLERKAMISRSGSRPARFHPAPPDMVVDALVSAREEELQRTRLAARELSALLHAAPEQPQVSEMVEVLTSAEAVVRRWRQLQRATRSSLEVFVRPPFARAKVGEDEELQRSLHERGCEVRGIYDELALQSPGLLESLRRTIAFGEEARVCTSLPVKLALFDRRLAFVPLGRSDDADTLVVHESPLLDALAALFDLCWQRSLPFTEEPVSAEGEAANTSHADVIALLRAGLKDEAIAHQLGVSTTTIRRRINALSRQLGVSTRFQLGLALGQRGASSRGRGPSEAMQDADQRCAG